MWKEILLSKQSNWGISMFVKSMQIYRHMGHHKLDSVHTHTHVLYVTWLASNIWHTGRGYHAHDKNTIYMSLLKVTEVQFYDWTQHCIMKSVLTSHVF